MTRNSSSVRRGNSPVPTFAPALLGAAALIAGCAPSGDSGMSPIGGGSGGTFKVGGGDLFHIRGPEGGPFPQGTRDYHLTNQSKTRVVEWSVEASVPWLRFSEVGGTIAPKATVTITAEIDQVFAATLPVGDYPADIVFRDQASPQNGDVYLAFLLTVEPKSGDHGTLAVTPAADFDVSGDVGGPFTPSSTTYVVENVGESPLDWSAEATESWVLLSGPTGGTLDPAQTADVLVTLDDTALKNFTAGNYVATIKFDNVTNSMGSTTRRVNLHVSDPGGGDGRVTAGLQLLYDFDEGSGDVVHDVSGMQPPIDLVIEEPQDVGWGPGSLALNSPTIVASQSAATRLADAVQSTDAITVEAWIQPQNLQQEGPARIVTLSDGAYDRNFTLGQGRWNEYPQDAYNMRLRSTATDLDGMPLVSTGGGVAKLATQHVLYTRDASGAAKMYVDNVEQASGLIGGDLSNWDASFHLALGNEIGADRPWLGILHLVAVYDRALAPAEVQQNFLAGPGGGNAGILAVAPATDFATSGLEGQVPAQSETFYTASNIGDEPMAWSVTANEPWIAIDTTGGVLDPGKNASVKVSLVSNIVLNFAPGFYTARVDFTNHDTGFGNTSRYVKLTIYSEGGGGDGDAEMEYFEKTNGSLDYMGVKITRASGSQKLWAPGTPPQEFPGGWVTPGTYTVALNQPRVHGKKDGVLTGQLRSGDNLVGVVVNKPLEWEGWENHAYTQHPDFVLENWGQSKTISLLPGDVLHVGYGTPVPITFGTRQGSDGIVVHCVATQPEPRGGLWGLGMTEFDQVLWDRFRQQVVAAAPLMTVATSYYNWGPADGTLPAVLPSDLGQDPGNTNNEQARTVGRWLQNRGFQLIKNGPGSLNVAELERLYRWYFNNIQLMGQWGEDVTAHNHYAHGTHRYAPYFVTDGVMSAMVAAVALDYTPTYEPMYRVLSHMAQRTDMTMSNSGCYSFKNGSGGGESLADHKDDNSFTKWLWYTLKHTDMTAKASHRMAVWAPCYWARELLRYPQTARQAVTLSSVGPAFDNPDGSPGSWWGHEWIETGAGPGWHYFYADLEMQGSHFLWFTGLERDSQFAQFSRRSILATNSYSAYFTKWTGATFIGEPRNPSGSAQGGKSVLSWSPVSGNSFSHYRVYRSTQGGPYAAIGDASTTGFTDSNVSSGKVYHYRIAAVRTDGHEGSKSSVVKIQH